MTSRQLYARLLTYVRPYWKVFLGDLVCMGLSSLTVKSHMARIARKLGSGDRAQLVAIAMRAALIH